MAIAVIANSVISFVVILGQEGGGNATGIAALITQIGLSGVFLFLYWQERKERQNKDEFILKFVEQFGPALANSSKVLGEAITQVQKAAEVLTRDRDYDDRTRRR